MFPATTVVSDKHSNACHIYIGSSWAVVCLVAVDSAVRGVIVVCQQPGTESGESGQAEKALGVPRAKGPSPAFIVESNRGHFSRTVDCMYSVYRDDGQW